MMARLAGALLLACLAGCAQMVPQTIALRTGWPAGVPETVEMKTVPFFPQDDYQCGPAALATVLAYSGVPVQPEQLASQVFLPARKGSLQVEMLAAARQHGRISYELSPRYPALLSEVAAGNPVVVLQDVGPMFTEWHYAVVNGFDYPSGTIWLRSGREPHRAMPFTAFERTWMKGNYWSMVVTPPDRIPVTATEDGWLRAVLAFARVDKGEGARQAYAAALRRWPDNIPAAIGLANEHHARGALADAVAVLRRARQQHPDSVIIANNLAQSLSDVGHQKEALALIDKVSDAQGPFAAEVRATRQTILQRIAQQKTGRR
jgi:tetratricopeptide (TPR) repeat protein